MTAVFLPRMSFLHRCGAHAAPYKRRAHGHGSAEGAPQAAGERAGCSATRPTCGGRTGARCRATFRTSDGRSLTASTFAASRVSEARLMLPLRSDKRRRGRGKG